MKELNPQEIALGEMLKNGEASISKNNGPGSVEPTGKSLFAE